MRMIGIIRGFSRCCCAGQRPGQGNGERLNFEQERTEKTERKKFAKNALFLELALQKRRNCFMAHEQDYAVLPGISRRRSMGKRHGQNGEREPRSVKRFKNGREEMGRAHQQRHAIDLIFAKWSVSIGTPMSGGGFWVTRGVKGRNTGATVSETLRYLQSESAEAGIEIGTLVKYLLLDAIKARASDIHIEPWESTLAVRIRLNGVLTELVHLPLELMEKIVRALQGAGQSGHLPNRPAAGRPRAGRSRNWAGSNSAFPFFPRCAGKRSSCAFLIPAIAVLIWRRWGLTTTSCNNFSS